MTRIRDRRRGLSLTEVLVSIFILSIGLMALMALFPIGALQMAQAMKDDRAGQDAANAERIFRTWWKSTWFNASGALNIESAIKSTQPAIAGLDDRNDDKAITAIFKNQLLPNTAALLPTDSVPSYPVLIDPIGVANNSNAATAKYWVAGGQEANPPSPTYTRYIPRRDMTVGVLIPDLAKTNKGMILPFGLSSTITAGGANGIRVAEYRFRYCALADELTYNANGTSGTGAANSVKREANYNHAWQIQRLNNSVRPEVNLQVLVFRRRPTTDVANPEFQTRATYTTGAPSAANPYPIFTDGSAIARVHYTGGRPPIRRNGWVMNATQYQVTETTGYNYAYTRQLADWYRVIGITEGSDALGSFLELELQTPVRVQNIPAAFYTLNKPPVQVLIAMDNLVEVFDRGTISAFDKPAP